MQGLEAKIDTIVQIAKRFYVDNQSQIEISKALGLSRPTVSRMLKKAVDTGIVNIHINDISYELLRLGEQVASNYGLKQAIIVKSNDFNPAVSRSEAAFAASSYFSGIVQDSSLVGMSHGTTTFRMLDYLRPNPSLSVNAVQLQGNAIFNEPFVQGSYIVMELARILGGTAYAMHAPLSVESRTLHDLMLEEEFMQNHYRLFRKLDIALVGIGTGMLEYDAYGRRDGDYNRELVDKRAVSNICNCYFTKDGEYISTDYQSHAFGIPYEDLKAVPEVIGVAVGAQKKDAVLAALRSGVVNTIVTDERIAAYVLSQ